MFSLIQTQRGATAAVKTAVLAPLLLILAACGGGGDAATPASPPTSSKPITASGAISGFGSVFVNGVRFDTSGAEIEIGDRRGSESELRVGHVVRVAGRLNADGRSGSASSIRRHDVVEGPVQSVDAAAGMLVVLGQAVIVDALTSFDDRFSPASLAGVAVGSNVEVSGVRDANGAIRATRIEPQRSGEDFEVLGTVSQLDTANRRFSIEALTVDYSSAQLDDLPGGALANGLLVEVHGSTLDASGALLATRIEGKRPGLEGEDDDEARLEGLITRFVSASDFDVDGQRVTTDSGTRFERGTSADLALNVRVEVEGSLDGGVLRASKIEFAGEADLRVAATVGSVDAAAGTFTVLGITVQTSNATRFEDKTDAQLRSFNVAALRSGDFVEVRGRAGSLPNSIAAMRVERDDPESEVELRGPALDVAEPQLRILGVTVLTNAQTEFEGEDDAPIGAAAFFAAAAGRIVKVDGHLQGDVVVAREIELEDHD